MGTKKQLEEFFHTQKLTALATQEPDHPYLSLMAFTMTDNLNHMIIATKRGTRKYSNIINSPGVAFLMDNRANQKSNFLETMAVTGIGKARETEGDEKDSLVSLFLGKHPELGTFVKSQDCAVFKIKIMKLIIISQFEEAEVLDLP